MFNTQAQSGTLPAPVPAPVSAPVSAPGDPGFERTPRSMRSLEPASWGNLTHTKGLQRRAVRM